MLHLCVYLLHQIPGSFSWKTLKLRRSMGFVWRPPLGLPAISCCLKASPCMPHLQCSHPHVKWEVILFFLFLFTHVYIYELLWLTCKERRFRLHVILYWLHVPFYEASFLMWWMLTATKSIYLPLFIISIGPYMKLNRLKGRYLCLLPWNGNKYKYRPI